MFSSLHCNWMFTKYYFLWNLEKLLFFVESRKKCFLRNLEKILFLVESRKINITLPSAQKATFHVTSGRFVELPRGPRSGKWRPFDLKSAIYNCAVFVQSSINSLTIEFEFRDHSLESSVSFYDSYRGSEDQLHRSKQEHAHSEIASVEIETN